MNPDGVSVSCDAGAHERCPACACGCHTPDSRPAPGGAGRDDRSRRRLPPVAGAGSLLIAWGHRDRRTLIQVLSAAIPGAIALGLLGVAIVLGSQGLL